MQVAAFRQGDSRIGDQLIDDLHALRARVFHDQLKWDVTVKAGRERDEYDALEPTHIVVLDLGIGRLLGGARLLPLSGPTMLNGPFSLLLEDGPFTHSHCLESSRFCIDRAAIGAHDAIGGVQVVTLALLAGILAFTHSQGATLVATVTDIRFERLLTSHGLSFERLGPPRMVGSTKAVAGIVPVDSASIARLLPRGCVLAFAGPAPKAEVAP